jgi:hypothetical protein
VEGTWRARGGHGVLTPSFAGSTLLLPRSLVLAAVLVVVTGARVALAPSHRIASQCRGGSGSVIMSRRRWACRFPGLGASVVRSFQLWPAHWPLRLRITRYRCFVSEGGPCSLGGAAVT